MRNICAIVLIFGLSCQSVRCSADDDFVDPFDMLNYDGATKSMKRTAKDQKDGDGPVRNDRCTAFLPRFVNILVKSTGLLNSDYADNDEEIKSYASVTISGKDLQLLKTIASTNDINYVELDRILNGMFVPEKKDNISGFKLSNGGLQSYYDQIKDLLYWFCIGSTSILTLYVVYRNIHYTFSITFVLFIVLTLAFASTWYTMYMKAEINRSVYLEHMPSHCKKNTGGLMSWFTTNNIEECRKYKEAILLDPKYSIALTEVFAEMLSKILMKPLENLGDSIYVFNKSVLKDFPVAVQWCLVPVIIIIVIKTMLLSCALLVGRNLSMKSIFGYGSTSIGSGPSNNDNANTNNRANPNSSPTHGASAQHTIVQQPQIPPSTSNVNFNINLFHPSSSIDHKNKTRDNRLISFDNGNMNHIENKTLISMLKNKDIDSVDHMRTKELTVGRHRAMSM